MSTLGMVCQPLDPADGLVQRDFPRAFQISGVISVYLMGEAVNR
jgi:hypothetical protein